MKNETGWWIDLGMMESEEDEKINEKWWIEEREEKKGEGDAGKNYEVVVKSEEKLRMLDNEKLIKEWWIM